MIIVELWRDYRPAIVATFRQCYGVSAWGIRIGGSISWGEAVDLVDAALEDTSTPLFAAVADWDWPISMPQVLMISGLLGDGAESFMPWNQEVISQVNSDEIEAAHQELLSEIRFT